jgi:hypothetical protein
MSKFLVMARTHTPAGKPRTMAQIIRGSGDGRVLTPLRAALLALDNRRDKGRPFVGEVIRVTPLIGPLMDHGTPVEFVYNPDTHELDQVRSSPT